MKKKGLGKGIDSLWEDEIEEVDENSIVEVKLTQVEPNREQPRKNFDKEKLEALAMSIKENGMIQPITVTKNGIDKYIIVAGERRWRASKLAGLTTIPVIIRDYEEQTIAELALIENLQREDLNPVEEALGYKQLSEKYGLKQEEISAKVGKSRSAVANAMRLLSLEEEFQKMLIAGEISEGHARTALSIEDYELRRFLINRIVEQNLNVRQAEALAKQLQKAPKEKKQKEHDVFDIEMDKLQNELSFALGTKVKIVNGAKKGKIEIEYYGNDDLERLLNIIKK